MCGIIGIIGKEKQVPVKEHLKLLRDAIPHRGPDDYGEHIGNNYGFANLRLSIVDIAGGKQPIYNDDESVGIVYNGEIYNYKELRKNLTNKGCKFKTGTDTEVILRAYEAYDIESFNKLNGMFAFCIWDNKRNCVYLVRDHFGIKPLYIYEDDEQLLFSSELKGILSVPGLDLTLDPIGFQDYLMFRYVQSPYTFFKKIRRLDAGTYLEIKNGKHVQYKYWDISYRDAFPRPDIDKVKKELIDKTEKSIKSQLMGEVPVGVLLSGGLDSSTIAYFVKKCGANLKTFNIGFPEVNEFKYSSEVAKKFGLEHIEISINPDELIKNFDNVILALDEPIADPACLPLYVLCQELKKHVTVVLSGEGGDEVFAGYHQYMFSLMNKKPYEQRFDYFLERSWYFKNYKDFLKDDHIAPLTLRYKKYFEEQPLLNGMLAYDMKTWIPENLMMKADKILMAHSLEGRFPFLDKGLFEYVAKLPQDYKLNKDGTTKWILKEVIGPYLPKSVTYREKMGFTVPVDKMLDELKPQVLEVFEKIKKTEVSQVLNTEYMKEFVNKYFSGDKNITALQVWTLFVMCYWFVYCMPRYREGKNLLPGRRRELREGTR